MLKLTLLDNNDGHDNHEVTLHIEVPDPKIVQAQQEAAEREEKLRSELADKVAQGLELTIPSEVLNQISNEHPPATKETQSQSPSSAEETPVTHKKTEYNNSNSVLEEMHGKPKKTVHNTAKPEDVCIITPSFSTPPQVQHCEIAVDNSKISHWEHKPDPDGGRWGEWFAFHYFKSTMKSGFTIKWLNETTELGKPFDLEISALKNDTTVQLPAWWPASVSIVYLEVKSTATADKFHFEISEQEMSFARNHRGNYQIMRVFNSGNPDLVSATITSDPYSKWEKHEVKVFLYL